MTSHDAGEPLHEAIAVMDTLRSDGGCPWDRRQTHASLAPYAVEEAHEVAEAAEAGDREELIEELGDLLLQVLFHARVGEEGSLGEPFDIDDVATGLTAKLRRRHPHVFADGQARTADDVTAQWTAIKAQEKPRESVLDGIPAALPALARTQKILSRAERAGICLPDVAELAEEEADSPERIGADLLTAVRRAQAAGVDAEAQLRTSARDLERTVRAEEQRRGRSGSGPSRQ